MNRRNEANSNLIKNVLRNTVVLAQTNIHNVQKMTRAVENHASQLTRKWRSCSHAVARSANWTITCATSNDNWCCTAAAVSKTPHSPTSAGTTWGSVSKIKSAAIVDGHPWAEWLSVICADRRCVCVQCWNSFGWHNNFAKPRIGLWGARVADKKISRDIDRRSKD